MCRFILKIAAMVIAGFVVSGGVAAQDDDYRELGRKLSVAIPGLVIQEVRPIGIDGLVEVVGSNGGTVFATTDGSYLITGDLLQVTDEGLANLSANARQQFRAQLIGEYDRAQLISYPAVGEQKAEISVFTDIDCPFCQKFHREIPRLNELGVRVTYFGFPRSGPGQPSFNKYVSVWCSEDRNAAMDVAKSGQSVPPKNCENPVMEQFRLGNRVGVEGTPATILEDGRMIPGYRPAEKMAEVLGLL